VIQFLILVHVIPNILQNAFHRKFTFRLFRQTGLILLSSAMAAAGLLAAENPGPGQHEDFTRAWWAAAHGKRADFEQLMPGLKDYQLYPYLQYEDLRYRRALVSDGEMVSFLEDHEDWAFTAGLKKSWLRTLGARSRWDSLIKYAPGSADTEIQCYLAHARINRGQTQDLLSVAQSLWAVGKSQPDACDPVFSWLKKEGGITSGLAWERTRRAMDERQPKLTLYLDRFLTQEDRV